MRKIYVGLAALLVVAVVTQFYFAAFGVFQAPRPEDSFALHLLNGRFVLPLLMLLTVAAAALARAPGRLIWFTLAPLGLLILQIVLFVVAALTGSSPERTTLGGTAILGLHAVNGLAILLVSVLVLRRAVALDRGRIPLRGSRPATPPPPAESVAARPSSEAAPTRGTPARSSERR